jgi:hypothetical protein
MWCLAHPKIGEREVVAALLDHDQDLIRDGQVLLADKGFSGKDFAASTAAHGIELLRPDRLDETYRNVELRSPQRVARARERAASSRSATASRSSMKSTCTWSKSSPPTRAPASTASP